jgi:flagellar biosynthesis protein FlhG
MNGTQEANSTRLPEFDIKNNPYSSVLHSTLQARGKIVAVGGGKGGVGKTVTTLLLGAACARKGNRVVIFDADWNGANLHTCLGIDEPQKSIYHFRHSHLALKELLIDTPFPGVEMICGASGLYAGHHPTTNEKRRLIRELKQLPADLVFIDLGASNNFHVIDFFLASDIRLIVTTPDITSIQDAFYFTKLAIIRRLLHAFNNHTQIRRLLFNPSETFGESSKISIVDILDILDYYEPGTKEFARHLIKNFQPGLILNMVRDKYDLYEIQSLKIAMEELLHIHPQILTSIDHQQTEYHSNQLIEQFINQRGIWSSIEKLAKEILKQQKMLKYASLLNKKPGSEMFRSSEKEELICSVRCTHWNECNYQHGGQKCNLYHLQATI